MSKQETLIEKLEKELAKNCRLNNWDLGFKEAINIVKKHSEWISVDECLPPDEIKLLFEHEDYGIIIGYYREKGEFVTYDTHYNYREPISKFSKWCYIPPSKVK